MQISLKKLSIKNFKGLKDFEADFQHVTNVYGQNASGKTTLFDAFLWLFFGKNSEDVAVFEVKRLDEKGAFIRDLEAEVEAIIHVDDQEIAVKKILRQKWVKRRGELTPAYQGDENVYFWNDVPLKETEFKVKIKGIIEESLFRLITNPFYFNSLKWQERRNILVALAGEITNESVLDSIMTVSNKGQYASLITALNQRKSIDEFKKEIAVKKKKIKDEMEQIQPRIDEVKRGMPEALDFTALRKEIEKLQEEQDSIEDLLQAEYKMASAANSERTKLMNEYHQRIQEKQQRSFELKSQIQNIEFQAAQLAKDHTGKLDAEIRSIESQIQNNVAERKRFQTAIGQFEAQLQSNTEKLDALRKKYIDINASEMPAFDDHAFNCPTCKQSLPEDDIQAKKDELTANFNKKKLADLEELNKQASQLKEDNRTLQDRIAKGNIEVSELSSNITALTNSRASLLDQKGEAKSADQIKSEWLAQHSTYGVLKQDLDANEALVIEVPVFQDKKQNEDLLQQKNQVSNQIAQLQKELAKEDQIKAAEDRVIELQRQEEKLSQELANLEGTEYAILQFNKAKVDMIESRINGKFRNVRFRMFEQQVNGGESETCETLVNSNGSWVPFSDANNAAKVNAGLDIINTLCRHYDSYAPIFVDNRESVLNVIDTDSQLVNLIVSGADKSLRVA